MKVEIMIYVYLAICFCMIVFNTVCIIVFRRREKRISKRSRTLERRVEEQLRILEEHDELEASHRRYLNRTLRRAANLLAFEETLDRIYLQQPDAVDNYLQKIYPVFVYLMLEYRKRDDVLVTFYLYILRKYRVLYQKPIGTIHDVVLALIRHPGTCCRENALQAVYSCGDPDSVVQALVTIDEEQRYHNSKLISDGLLTFPGDTEKLAHKLWEQFEIFSLDMKCTLLNYFRFSSDGHRDNMLALLNDRGQHDELRFSAIRYFGKYYDERAFPVLIELAQPRLNIRWEYAAIASTALAAYPSAHTADILKANLHSEVWYIRFNAAQSLERLGLDYVDMIDIFEGDDRYAREMLQYRMDQRKTQEVSVL